MHGRRHPARDTKSLRWTIVAAILAAFAAAPAAAHAAAPYVRVEAATITRTDGATVVDATVRWNAAGVRDEQMVRGDVRLLAIGVDRRVKLRRDRAPSDLAGGRLIEQVRFRVTDADGRAALAPGRRVALTATQHQLAFAGAPSLRSYLTTVDVQRGLPRDYIGRRDCSDRAIVAGANLVDCNLTGAYLRGAQVSIGREVDATRLERTDLTGADLRDSELTRARLGMARINDADATEATIEGLSIKGTEGLGFTATGPQTLFDDVDAFGADLTTADLHGARFLNASFADAVLDRADLRDTAHDTTTLSAANLIGTQLQGATFVGEAMRFANLTAANLTGAVFTEAPPDPREYLATIPNMATMCRTVLPDGTTDSRDCTRATPIAVTSLVPVQATLTRRPATKDAGPTATIAATVTWDTGEIGQGLGVGELRLVAVDRGTGLPTVLGRWTGDLDASKPQQTWSTTLTTGRTLDAIERGNRVVVTATQRSPITDADATQRSLVTVDEVQGGPIRGRVGSLDCSDRPVTPGAILSFCDLVGSVLRHADLSGDQLVDADLTGADLRDAVIGGATMDGAHLAGAVADGAALQGGTMIRAVAPRLQLSGASFVLVYGLAVDLRDADLSGTTINQTYLAGGNLNRIDLDRATMVHADVFQVGLRGAKMRKLMATGGTSLELSDLTGANMLGATIGPNEDGGDALGLDIFCLTVRPDGRLDVSDCPR